MERLSQQSAAGELAEVTALHFLAGTVLSLHLAQVWQWSKGMKGAWDSERPTDSETRSPDRSGLDRQATALTVVLPVRNEAHTLPWLMADLEAQTRHPDAVIVIDDQSDDGTLHALHAAGPWSFPVVTMANPGRGKKAGLSAGIRAAATPWAVGVDADTRLGKDTLWSIEQALQRKGHVTDMALLPLRIADRASGPPDTLIDRLQALDFAAMQGWAIAAVRRGRPAMASGGGWVWRCAAFPHGELRPDIPSGDDVFALAALIRRGDAHRVQWFGRRASMVSAAPMPTLRTLLDQRIRWGAKSTAYPPALSEARRVAWTVALLNGTGLACLLIDPWAGLVFWGAKSMADMAYTARVGRDFQLLPASKVRGFIDLLLLAVLHPLFLLTTLFLMPFRSVQWKGRKAH